MLCPLMQRVKLKQIIKFLCVVIARCPWYLANARVNLWGRSSTLDLLWCLSWCAALHFWNHIFRVVVDSSLILYYNRVSFYGCTLRHLRNLWLAWRIFIEKISKVEKLSMPLPELSPPAMLREDPNNKFPSQWTSRPDPCFLQICTW